MESPVAVVTTAAVGSQLVPPTIYQVVYDISGLGGAGTGLGQENVISIELGESVPDVLFFLNHDGKCVLTSPLFHFRPMELSAAASRLLRRQRAAGALSGCPAQPR